MRGWPIEPGRSDEFLVTGYPESAAAGPKDCAFAKQETADRAAAIAGSEQESNLAGAAVEIQAKEQSDQQQGGNDQEAAEAFREQHLFS